MKKKHQHNWQNQIPIFKYQPILGYKNAKIPPIFSLVGVSEFCQCHQSRVRKLETLPK